MAFPTPRCVGVLVFWHLSTHGGFGKIFVPSSQQFFFVPRKFIISGEPIPGSQVTFTPLPAAPGKTDPQAGFAVIDNTKRVQLTVPSRVGA